MDTLDILRLREIRSKDYHNLGDNYNKYLNSLHWKTVKRKYYESSLYNGKCYCCGALYSKDITFNLHHLTYERLGEEDLTDLVVVCTDCHEKIHRYHKAHPNITLYDATQKIKDIKHLHKIRKHSNNLKYGGFTLDYLRYVRKNRTHGLGKEYDQYLNSEHWKDVKLRYYQSKLYKGECYCCHRKVGSGVDFHLHHKTYKRLGEERLNDLELLCVNCHDKIHDILSKATSKNRNLWNVARYYKKKLTRKKK